MINNIIKIPKYYTGIGSRSCPAWAYDIAYQLAILLSNYDYTLRSGGADGMDTAFERGCDSVNGKREIYLPWKGFNGNESHLYEIDTVAMEAAEYIHPYWNRLSPGAKKLHARNVYQITGYHWKHYSKFIICYTPLEKGGTLQAIRIANEFNIPVVNLYDWDSSLWDTQTKKGKNEIITSVLKEILIYRYKLKAKKGFYCKLFNNYRYDGKCNDMDCEFCDDYYENQRIESFLFEDGKIPIN